jgi:deoxycytidylate deaminase
VSLANGPGDSGGRTGWDRYFLNLAAETAARSNCIRRQHGAVIVKNRRIRSTGYNGPPSGHPHCDEGACPRATSTEESGWGHDNCFHGDTEFLTRQGVRRLRETAGEVVEVLTSRGWKQGKIEHFGRQQLLSVKLKRYAQEQTILATAEHRWFIADSHRKQRVILTRDLRASHYLANAYVNLGNVKPSIEGVRAGLVFGDGSCNYHQPGSGAFIHLYGASATDLRWIWEGHPHTSGDRILNLPRRWKTERPPLDESLGYLYGWLQGYFAADGCLSHSTPVLDSANRENLEYVIELCYILGIPTLGIRTTMRQGFGEEPTCIYRLTFPQGSLEPDFFLIPHHREKAGIRSRRRDLPRWRVVSIEETKGEHDVYCAVVPDLHEFTLAGNIRVGNCIAIHAEANAILYSSPEQREGATIYITGVPCFGCAKLIANSGIQEVVTEGEVYQNWKNVRSFLLNSNVRVRLL